MPITPQAHRKKLPTALQSIVFYGVAFGSFRMLIGGVSVLYLLSRGVSLADLGLLKSFQFALMMFLDLPLSYLTDRYSRKLSTILGIVFGAAWLLMTAAASSLWQFYLAEALNAVSLSLFNGAYIAYLIDSKNKVLPEFSTKSLLAYDNKYNSLGMAICAFIGAAFISPNSNVIWYIAGVILSLLAIGAYVQMPSDRQLKPKPQNQNSTPVVLLISHTKELKNILKRSPSIVYALFIIAVLLVYFQIIIQLWQPFVDLFNPSQLGWVYGGFFTVISLAQLVSSWFVDSSIHPKYKQLILGSSLIIALSLMALSASFMGKSWLMTVAALVSLSVMFFSVKVLTINASAQFHDIIPNEHRSVLDALSFFGSRLCLLILFPAITFLIHRFGFITLMPILLVVLLIYLSLKYRIDKITLT